MIFKDNIPFIPQGLGHDRVSFTGGRVGVDMTEKGGITRVFYFGNQPIGRQDFFNSGDPIASFTKIFRPYVVIGGRIYYLALNNTLLYPFGYQSEFQVGAVKLRHGLILLNDTIAFTAEILENPEHAEICLRLVHSQYTKVSNSLRTWGKYELDPANGLTRITAADKAAESKETADDMMNQGIKRPQEPDGETVIALSADLPLSFRDAGPGFRLYAQTAPIAGTATMFVNFAPSEAASASRLAELRQGISGQVDGVIREFEKTKKQLPAIKVDSPTVQSFLALAPAMVNAMKVKDVPGVIRAANSGYWTWAWDSMVYSDAYLLWHDRRFSRELLEFYRQSADPEYGIAHMLNAELKFAKYLPFAAQAFYNILLYNYYLFTGDKETLREYFPFAQSLLERALNLEFKDTGLIEAVGYVPDAPQSLDQDGHDLCVVNNGLFYQGLRAMETLALELNDHHYASRMSSIAQRCRTNFIKHFYDAEKGFFIDSVSSRDFRRREHYPTYAIVWTTTFAEELIPDGEAPRIAEFLEKNLLDGLVFFQYPKWDSCFMKEGNQSSYAPCWERFVREVMRLAGRTAALTAWFQTVDWYWGQHTIPECHACEAENENLSLDNPGRQQMMGVKAWYSTFMHAMAGIEVTADGITIRPQKANLEIRGLRIRDKTIDVTADAAGKVGIRVDGRILSGTDHIPFA